MTHAAVDLDARIDGLYRLPIADFTGARNELSQELRRQKAKEEAARVKALKKPSVPAWAANQVVHHYPDVWAELLEATEGIRGAHARGVADLAPALERRKRALAAAVETASGILTRAKHAPGLPQLRRVGNTLDALSSGLSEQPPGRVVQDLEPPGFGALVGLAFAPPPLGNAAAGATGSSNAISRSKPRGADGGAPSTVEKRGSGERTEPSARTNGSAEGDRARERAAEKRRLEAKEAVARAQAGVQRLEDEARDAERTRAEAERQHEEAVLALDAARAALEEARRRNAEAQASEAGLRRRLEKLDDAEATARAALTGAQATLEKTLVALAKTGS